MKYLEPFAFNARGFFCGATDKDGYVNFEGNAFCIREFLK
jgi:hypothetical protein